MAESSAIDQAMRRLDEAIKTLEAAADGQNERLREQATFEEELQRAGLDRSNLAQALDAEQSRVERLTKINQEASHRLVAAMETVRGILAAEEGRGA